MTLDEFIDFYKKRNYLPLNIYSNPKKKLNNNQLKIKYKKYLYIIEKEKGKKEDLLIKKIVKDQEKFESGDFIDAKWIEILEKVKKRDNNQCRLIKILSKKEIDTLFNNAPGFLLNNLEGAHCVSRAKSKNLYYEEKNIYLINNWSHRNLDKYECPITGKPIKKDEVEKWWIKIVGKEIYSWLKENK